MAEFRKNSGYNGSTARIRFLGASPRCRANRAINRGMLTFRREGGHRFGGMGNSPATDGSVHQELGLNLLIRHELEPTYRLRSLALKRLEDHRRHLRG
jgi:hypothetical protein